MEWGLESFGWCPAGMVGDGLTASHGPIIGRRTTCSHRGGTRFDVSVGVCSSAALSPLNNEAGPEARFGRQQLSRIDYHLPPVAQPAVPPVVQLRVGAAPFDLVMTKSFPDFEYAVTT
jgi:hypothetical protein